jgi:hypothetical protein
MKWWNNFKSQIKKKLQEDVTQKYLLTSRIIIIHCPIVFLALFFFLNLLKGVIISLWWITILNLLGAGCLYYLFIDLSEYIAKLGKGRE